VWDGVSRSPAGEGSGKGAMPLPIIFFFRFLVPMASFSAFWGADFIVVELPILHA